MAVLGLAWRDAIFCMYTAYLDCSGKPPKHECTVVAGFASTCDRWIDFEVSWNETLRKFDVPYFHMKEFAHSVGPFSTWKGDETRRRAFLCALIEIIERTVIFGTAVAIPHKAFTAASEEFAVASVFKNEYVFAGRECAANFEEWRSWHDPDTALRDGTIRYVFDRGDEGYGALRDLFESDGLTTPSFEPSRDDLKVGRKGVVQLQAADFAAYEYFRLYEPDKTDDLPVWEPPFLRKSGGLLRDGVDTAHTRYTQSMIVYRCQERGIPRRSGGAT